MRQGGEARALRLAVRAETPLAIAHTSYCSVPQFPWYCVM